jgi:CubicO group peptidase (beta-lactamase class C family)/D-alanyl-D-alanine dipeptidase
VLPSTDVGARTGVAPTEAYAELADLLSAFIEREMEAKEIPALSIALVDDQQTVWSAGFGHADPDGRIPATASTVYRVGSVSKLFTDMAVMQLVERGEIDLDRDVREYVPELELDNRFGEPVTLRQLMAHRSGLIREPPVGNYFDPSEPSLESTIESLRGQPLVYSPTSRVKYSNAGIAVVGYALERATGTPFVEAVRSRVLAPLGMTHSDFERSDRVRDDLAKGYMWTYDGRVFEAPTFELGMAPAGSLYSSVSDLAIFLQALFRGGGGVLEPETLQAMYEPAFQSVDPNARYGLGFSIEEMGGEKRLGHGGAIYGFSTDLAFLPERKLGVVAVASKDFSNSVVGRVTKLALDGMLALGERRPLPSPDFTTALAPGRARNHEGLYQGPSGRARLFARGDRLYLDRAPRVVEVSALSDELHVDSTIDFGPHVELLDDGAGLRVGNARYERIEDTLPEEPPARFHGLIGEYGWDHNTLYVLEKDGKLHALIEWFENYPLEELGADRFAFPDYGLYHGEELVFEREPTGRATSVVAASVRFDRREVGTRDGETFRIEPVLPVGELRTEALAARPPVEEGEFRASDLVELISLEPTIALDIRYASTNNFMAARFYQTPRAFLQRPAAEALVRAHRALRDRGFGLWIHDAYRPWFVTKMFWDATPAHQKIFVADPSSGSRHNRGAAVDLTLFDLETKAPVNMVGGYDEFSARSFPDYPGGTSRQRFLRELLRDAMEAEGFAVYEHEWWHFDHESWELYPIGNFTFEELSP